VAYFLIRTPHQILVGDKIEEDKMDVACSMYGGEENFIQGLAEKLDGKRPLENPSFIWGSDIKMDLKEMGLGGVKWFYLAVAGCCESSN